MNWQERIVIDPGMLVGKPVSRPNPKRTSVHLPIDIEQVFGYNFVSGWDKFW